MKVLVGVLIFGTQADCFVLNCGFSYGIWLDIGLAYSCKATVSSSYSSTAITQVNGWHLFFNSRNNVGVLDISNSYNIQYFLTNIGSVFPNLIYLCWNGGSLTEVSDADLSQFSKLKSLDLSNHRIVTLHSDLFSYSQGLFTIRFNYNLIEQVGTSLFSGLNRLSTVSMVGNRCVSYSASNSQAISYLKSLLRINCPIYVPTTTTTSTTTIKPSTTTTTTRPTTTTTKPSTTTTTTKLSTTTTKPSTTTSTTTTTPSSTIPQLIPTVPNALCEDRLAIFESERNELIATFEEKITELEKQLREINTCS